MNKPAPKEPSMDEILSSIRQIIADDDASAAPRKPADPAGRSSGAQPLRRRVPRPVLHPIPVPSRSPSRSRWRFRLSRSCARRLRTMMRRPGLSFNECSAMSRQAAVELVDPDDIAFETTGAGAGTRSRLPLRRARLDEPAPRPAAPVAHGGAHARPRPVVSDMAEQLLEADDPVGGQPHLRPARQISRRSART